MRIKRVIRLLLDFYYYRNILSIRQLTRLYKAENSKVKGELVKIKFKKYEKPFWIRSGTSDVTIFKCVFLQNEYPIINKNTKVVIDAGANIGAASFFFKMYAPSTKIIAIEPDETNCEMFKLNMKHFSDVNLLKAALHNEEGLFMEIENPEASKYSFRMKLSKSGVYTTSLSSIIKEYGIKEIDLVKIDIEGGEKAVFEKNLEWLDISNTTILELHDHYVKGCSSTILKVFAKHNVEISWIGENLIFTKV